MQAYLNKPNLKNEVLAQMAMHREEDNLVKGQYWEDGKGCAVGCLIKGDDHSQYETMFGIPKELAGLEDAIFEGLPNDKAMLWPEKFLNAFEVGKDYTKVRNKFAVWLLIDPNDGVIKFMDSDNRNIIEDVANLHQRVVDNDPPKNMEWATTRVAVRATTARVAAVDATARVAAVDAAARAAIWAVVDAAAWDDAVDAAARAAAESVAWTVARAVAESAVNAAAWAAVNAAAWDDAYERMADKLIELIEEV